MADVAGRMISGLPGLFIGIFVVSALINGAILVSNARTHRDASPIFVLGGFFGALGFLLTPRLGPFAWLPLILEPATLGFLIFFPRLLGELWGTSRFNLVARYSARRGDRDVDLRLFRRRVFTLRLSFDRSPEQAGIIAISRIGEWDRADDRIVLRLGEESAEFEPTATGLRQAVGFPCFEDNPDFALAGLDLSRDPATRPHRP